MFIHLHWHSTFSFLEAIWNEKLIVSKAKELWMDSIAITDYNWMYWQAKFYQEAKKNWIKPIIWVEIWFIEKLWKKFLKKSEIWNIVLLAENKTWYYNLLKITSLWNTIWHKIQPKVDFEILKKHKEWISIFFWWDKSRIWKKIFENNYDLIKTNLIKFEEIFWKEHIFLEIISQDHTKLPNLKKINNKIIELSSEFDFKIIVWNSFHYVNYYDRKPREFALCIKDNKKIYDQDRRNPIWEYHIMSENEITNILIKNEYSDTNIKSRIQNNYDIAQWLNIEIDLHQALFPVYQTPENIKKLYEKHKNSLIEVF